MDKQRKDRISIRINGKERIFLSDEELNQEICAAKDSEDAVNGVDIVKVDSFFNENERLKEDQFVENKGNAHLLGENVDSEKRSLGENSSYDEDQWEDFVDDILLNDRRSNIIDFEERRSARIQNNSNGFNQKKTNVHYPSKKNILSNKKKKRNFDRFSDKQKAVYKKYIVSLIGAILIGVGFGYIVLSLFTDMNDENKAGEENGVITSGKALSEYNPNNEGSENTAIGTGSGSLRNASSVEIPALRVEVIQGGAFASLNAANEHASILKENGTAAVVLPESDPVLLFIGVGGSRAEANSIGEQYVEKGQEIYIKPFELDALEVEAGKARSATGEAVYAQTAVELYQKLVDLSAQVFETGTVEKNSWDSIKAEYSQWNKTKPEKLQPSLGQFANSITAAYKALESFRTNKNEAQLWKSQQALLEGLISYKTWHNEMSR
ncbi:hypothetical protein [Calidifontibacillus erzurumensis]|uniref:hypothetical protein n=1 Tax=Calidifontibacillus erzurumensis TaxID=2741433 RepID=UPI0035B52A80